MAIKRYTANAETTITNAFKADLTTRGTGANMGAADVLEIFSIYGQASGSSAGLSSELSRALIKFPVDDIQTDRSSSVIPRSGSVSFYLKMSNAPHTQTNPRDMYLMLNAVTRSWQEGTGLDMEQYTDLTYGKEGATWTYGGLTGSWQHMGGDFVSDLIDAAAATATITVTDAGALVDGETFVIVDTAGTSHTFTIETGDDLVADNKVGVQTAKAASNETTAALQFALAINDATSTCVNTISATHNSDATTTLTQKVSGILGTRTNTDGAAGVTIGNFTGGAGNPNKFYKVHFANGTEDLEQDITPLVEMWANDVGNIYGALDNYGLMVKLTGTQEAYNENYATYAIPNESGSVKSYYTKKFFGRSSEFFFRRPYIEARWNSSDKDDRGNFMYSSSLAPGVDNLNTLYLYNYVRGQLKDIPEIGTTGSIMVSLYSGSADDTAPSGAALQLSIGGGVSIAAETYATGGWLETGIYTCSLAITAAATPLATLYDVWSTGSIVDGDHLKTRFHTGSITPTSLESSNINPATEYALAVTNLKPIYSQKETARFRLYAREKGWNPTIYTKATTDIQNTIIESASYTIYRIADDLTVIPYGTGSDLSTQLSFDVSGNYFDLDMGMLDTEYAYGLKFAFYNGAIGTWVEQSDVFKFRVEEPQT
tara:strand:+ start:3181 stop:5148 length:1968 start_codon:yes stop_codon:yes gene_type:complete